MMTNLRSRASTNFIRMKTLIAIRWRIKESEFFGDKCLVGKAIGHRDTISFLLFYRSGGILHSDNICTGDFSMME